MARSSHQTTLIETAALTTGLCDLSGHTYFRIVIKCQEVCVPIFLFTWEGVGGKKPHDQCVNQILKKKTNIIHFVFWKISTGDKAAI